MKFIIFVLFLITSFIASSASIPNNNFKIGTSASVDKGFEFNFGGDNPKLQILSSDKSMSFDRDKLSVGTGAASGVKQLNFNGYNKSLSFETDTFKLDAQKLQVGDGTASSIDLLFNNGSNQKLRSNPTSGKLEFTNDGTLFKSMGSGGGGGSAGIILISNEGFEDGVTDQWSVTGGATVAEVTTGADLGFDDKSAKVTYSAAGTYCSDLATKPNALGFGCMASIYYKNGGTDQKVVVYDGSSNSLAELDLLSSTEWTSFSPLTFECKDEMKICFEGSSGDIVLDNNYLGNNKNFVTVTPNAKVLASVEAAGSTGQTITASVTPLPFTELSDPANAWSGDSYTVQSSNTIIELSGRMFFTTSAGRNTDLHVNGSFYKRIGGTSVSGRHESFVFIGSVGEFQKDDVLTLILDSGGTLETYTEYHSININESEFPDASQAAWYPDAQSFFVSANIGGSDITGVHESVPNNSSIDMIVNSGSPNITCSDGSQGALTCSTGNEQIGIEAILPVVGKYKVCINSSSKAISGSDLSGRIGLFENLTNNIISIGDSSFSIYNGNSVATLSGQRLCDVFNIASIGKATFKLYTEFTASAATIVADRFAGTNDRDVNITIELVSEGVNKPYVLNQVDTSVKGGVKINGCTISNIASPTFLTNDCSSWASSIAINGTADIQVNLQSGIFKDTPTCLSSSGDESYNGRCSVTALNSTTLRILGSSDSGAAHYQNCQIMCYGER